MKRFLMLGVDPSLPEEETFSRLRSVIELEKEVAIIGVGYLSIETPFGSSNGLKKLAADSGTILMHHQDLKDVVQRVHREMGESQRKGAIIHLCEQQRTPSLYEAFSNLGYMVEHIELSRL